MKIVFRYLKRYGFLVFLSILLLFGRVVSELSLPNLMSDIVNVGIQQSGIEETAPEAISENAFELLGYFMSADDQDTISDAYTFVEMDTTEADDLIATYPLLAEESIYVLKETATDEITTVGEAYSRSCYAFMTFMQNRSDSSSGSTENMNTSDMDFSAIYEMIPYFAMIPQEEFQDAIDVSAQADSAFTSQVGTAFIRIFYTELGIDTDSMQNNYILTTGGVMLAVTLLGAVASILVGLFAGKIGAGVSKSMRHDIFEKVEQFSNHEFDQFSTASLITRSTNDITQVQQVVVMGIRMILFAPLMGIGGVIMAVNKSVSMSWIIAVAVIVLIGVIMIVFSIAMPKFKIIQNLVDKVNLVTRENLSGMMVIRAFSNQKYEENRFEEANANLTATNLFVNRVMVFMMPFMMLIMNGMTVLVVWVASHQIAEATMQVGDMIAFMQYAMQIIFSFLMISMMFIMVPRAAVSANRIGEVIDMPLSIHDPKEPKQLSQKVSGEVTFDNVSFRYPNAENNVIENISFTAHPAQTTAIIGSTGSGKSTLINLIPRFYDVTEGSIKIDDVDIRDVTQKELRTQIGYIPQKGVLFSGTIDSNIRYGKEEATEEEVMLAAKIAQAEEFIEKNEQKYDLHIAQGGANVSGGQKQRLSIARAIIKHAPIYIFDDSFSALDFKTDSMLREALKKYTGESTVIIVAQRVSTIMNADQIIVLEEGNMVGIGKHEELLKTCDVYREIAESQLSKEELA